MVSELYRCAGRACPGLAYRASDTDHPASCVGDEFDGPAISEEADHVAYAAARVLESVRAGDAFMAGYWLACLEQWAGDLDGEEYHRASILETACFELAREFYRIKQGTTAWF